jgi:hypothetical protein
MTKRTNSTNCAHCGEVLPIVDGHVLSWRVHDKFTCNEFCADGIEDCPPVQADGGAEGARPPGVGFA